MAELQPTEVLFIPNRRRLTHAMLPGPEGQEVLHIFYGVKEIIIDEPDLLSFGNQLLKVERFRADEAKSWSSDAPYDWERVRGLLEALVSEDILKRFDDAPPAPVVKTFPPTLGRVPEGRKPETYSAHDDRCPIITERVFGRAIDLGNLEVVLPIHRVAHPAIDQDGRQVGENNVADKLFLDLPTERRLCNYAGSRYHAEAPINATALKHMSKRWPELLSLTEQLRTAFFARIPQQGVPLRIGDVHLLAVSCLSMVGYAMVRGVDPVPNGQLDPGLAAMFRLIDGVRIVTTQRMRDTAGNHGCERPASPKIISDYAERESLFIDKWGVCAGPQVLIDEYLHVLLDGASAPIKVQPDLAARVGDLDAALDYGLHGLRVEAMVRAYGAMQGFLHERLHQAFVQHSAAPSRLQELLAIPIDREHFPFLRLDHPLHETLEMEIRVGSWLFARARTGLPAGLPGILDDLNELRRFDPARRADGQRRLAAFLLEAAPSYASLPAPVRDEVAAVAVELFELERTCLRAVGAEQQRINERLRRQPGRALVTDDLAAYDRRCTPVVERVLAEGLGLSITTSTSATVVAQGPRQLSLND